MTPHTTPVCPQGSAATPVNPQGSAATSLLTTSPSRNAVTAISVAAGNLQGETFNATQSESLGRATHIPYGSFDTNVGEKENGLSTPSVDSKASPTPSINRPLGINVRGQILRGGLEKATNTWLRVCTEWTSPDPREYGFFQYWVQAWNLVDQVSELIFIGKRTTFMGQDTNRGFIGGFINHALEGVDTLGLSLKELKTACQNSKNIVAQGVHLFRFLGSCVNDIARMAITGIFSFARIVFNAAIVVLATAVALVGIVVGGLVIGVTSPLWGLGLLIYHFREPIGRLLALVGHVAWAGICWVGDLLKKCGICIYTHVLKPLGLGAWEVTKFAGKFVVLPALCLAPYLILGALRVAYYLWNRHDLKHETQDGKTNILTKETRHLRGALFNVRIRENAKHNFEQNVFKSDKEVKSRNIMQDVMGASVGIVAGIRHHVTDVLTADFHTFATSGNTTKRAQATLLVATNAQLATICQAYKPKLLPASAQETKKSIQALRFIQMQLLQKQAVIGQLTEDEYATLNLLAHKDSKLDTKIDRGELAGHLDNATAQFNFFRKHDKRLKQAEAIVDALDLGTILHPVVEANHPVMQALQNPEVRRAIFAGEHNLVEALNQAKAARTPEAGSTASDDAVTAAHQALFEALFNDRTTRQEISSQKKLAKLLVELNEHLSIGQHTIPINALTLGACMPHYKEFLAASDRQQRERGVTSGAPALFYRGAADHTPSGVFQKAVLQIAVTLGTKTLAAIQEIIGPVPIQVGQVELGKLENMQIWKRARELVVQHKAATGWFGAKAATQARVRGDLIKLLTEDTIATRKEAQAILSKTGIRDVSPEVTASNLQAVKELIREYNALAALPVVSQADMSSVDSDQASPAPTGPTAAQQKTADLHAIGVQLADLFTMGHMGDDDDRFRPRFVRQSSLSDLDTTGGFELTPAVLASTLQSVRESGVSAANFQIDDSGIGDALASVSSLPPVRTNTLALLQSQIKATSRELERIEAQILPLAREVNDLRVQSAQSHEFADEFAAAKSRLDALYKKRNEHTTKRFELLRALDKPRRPSSA